jgi:hypothetical protein
MAEEKNNIAMERGKLIHKSFKCELWVCWDIETLGWVIEKGGAVDSLLNTQQAREMQV